MGSSLFYLHPNSVPGWLLIAGLVTIDARFVFGAGVHARRDPTHAVGMEYPDEHDYFEQLAVSSE